LPNLCGQTKSPAQGPDFGLFRWGSSLFFFVLAALLVALALLVLLLLLLALALLVLLVLLVLLALLLLLALLRILLVTHDVSPSARHRNEAGDPTVGISALPRRALNPSGRRRSAHVGKQFSAAIGTVTLLSHADDAVLLRTRVEDHGNVTAVVGAGMIQHPAHGLAIDCEVQP